MSARTTRVLRSGSACTDCALIIANDDDSGLPEGPAHREVMAKALDRIGLGCPVISGEAYVSVTGVCDCCGYVGTSWHFPVAWLG